MRVSPSPHLFLTPGKRLLQDVLQCCSCNHAPTAVFGCNQRLLSRVLHRVRYDDLTPLGHTLTVALRVVPAAVVAQSSFGNRLLLILLIVIVILIVGTTVQYNRLLRILTGKRVNIGFFLPVHKLSVAFVASPAHLSVNPCVCIAIWWIRSSLR